MQQSAVYKSVKNPILYAMLFIMLLRCDLKKIIKLGPKMLIGFFAATLSIGLGFFCFICNIPPALRRRFMESTRRTVRKLAGRRRQYAFAIQAALDVDEANNGLRPCYGFNLRDTLCNVPSRESEITRSSTNGQKADTSIIDGVELHPK